MTGSFLLLNHFGVITIPITGYPGAAPTFRLMMHPDGERFGLQRLGRGRGRDSAAHLSPSTKTRRGEKTASRPGLAPTPSPLAGEGWDEGTKASSPSPLCPPSRHGGANQNCPSLTVASTSKVTSSNLHPLSCPGTPPREGSRKCSPHRGPGPSSPLQ